MTAVIWIVGVPEGAIRLGGHSGHVCRLLQPQFLQEASNAHGIVPWKISNERGCRRSYHAVGLCVVEACQTYQGPLTPYSRQEAVLFDFYGRSMDILTMKVLDGRLFEEPVEVLSCRTLSVALGPRDRHHTRASQEAHYSTKFPLAWPVEDWMGVDLAAGSGAQSPRDWLAARWPELANKYQDGTQIIMLQQVWQLANLACARAWDSVAVLGRWCRLDDGRLPNKTTPVQTRRCLAIF